MSQLYDKHDPEATAVDFHRELARVLNRHGIDTLLGTPDHVLATMVVKHLDAYGETVATTKRLAEGGPFRPFEHMTYDLNERPETRTVQFRCGNVSIEEEPLENLSNRQKIIRALDPTGRDKTTKP